MPINYSEYHPKWTLISKLIRFRRANNRCEWCGVMNHTVKKAGARVNDPGTDLYEFGNYASAKEFADILNCQSVGCEKDWVVIVLTVAHIDHDKTNNNFDNLAALCQKCHLRHDIHEHVRNRKYGRKWKENQLQIEGL